MWQIVMCAMEFNAIKSCFYCTFCCLSITCYNLLDLLFRNSRKCDSFSHRHITCHQDLWQSFLDAPMTEYRQFLWQKIMQSTHSDLKIMTQYLHSFSPEQLDAANINQYLRNQKIIFLTPEDYPSFVEELKQSLTLFATDETQKKKWKLLYQPLIHSSTIFAFSISSLMLEFHPDYRKYYKNIHACCMLLKDYLDSKEGEDFKALLVSAFQDYYDFEGSSYGELEVAAFFHKSVYNSMSVEEIEGFLSSI